MKTILVCNQKGGVGKSLVADELCFSFERTSTPLAFYDLDAQGGTIHQQSPNSGADVAVVDTPGTLHPDFAAWIASDDLVVVPTRASTRDIPPLLRTGEIVIANSKTDIPALIVVNAWNRFRACMDFLDWLRPRAPEKNTMILPQSEAFVQAAAAGRSVVDFAPGSQAAKATIALCNRVRYLLYMPEESEG